VNTGYKKPVPEEISIEGNKLLSEEDYLVFTKLTQNKNYARYTEAVVKDRFEKHPYIERADVELSGQKILKVNAVEKDIKAIIIIDSEPCLISKDYQVLPLFTSINDLDVPLITNIKMNENVKQLSIINNDDLTQAFRIIDAFGALQDQEILKNLSEINLNSRSGLTFNNEIVLSFTGINSQVIFGKGDEARKAVAFEALWKSNNTDEFNFDSSSYVDLRFTGKVYFAGINNIGVVQ
jgi:cell division septal protein FtsQ